MPKNRVFWNKIMSKNTQTSGLKQLTIAAIGVVYGDIGTSPLYTIKECFSPHIGLKPTADVIYGFLSLIFWAQLLVVSVKYLLFVLNAENKGEGGILTLMSLAGRNTRFTTTTTLLILGVSGAGLFYGDSIITPAMSVLSALEGIQVVAPDLKEYIVPATVVVLFLLFHIQRHGTAAVGRWFGPVMILWFATLAVLGLIHILKNPAILGAMHPKWAIHFLITYKGAAFIALGSVVLAITGGEALYADMGHFGKKPIRLAWFSFVAPALTLNYFGQGALIIRDPSVLDNPFFKLAPAWTVLPLVILATLATIIASQAVISGAFSMTQQAVRMGYLPAMTITHTSESEAGQIYMPFVNWALFWSILFVVVFFGESGKLAAAYGIAVTGTMAITTILACYVAIYNWNWHPQLVKTLGLLLLLVDFPFFGANIIKVMDGGWLPLGVGAFTFAVMAVWKWERFLLLRQLSRFSMPVDQFLSLIEKKQAQQVPGTAIYLSRTEQGIPHALIHNLNHNHVLHERIILMTIRTQDVPYVENEQRIDIKQIAPFIWRLTMTYGFHETPAVDDLFRYSAQKGMRFDLPTTTFFLSRETLLSAERSWLAELRAKVFIFLSKNALRTNDVIHIPADRVIEIGIQVSV